MARFRAEQVLWGLVGFVVAVSLTFGLPALAGRPVSAMAVVGGAVLGVLGGVFGRDGWLGRQIAAGRPACCASCRPSPTCSAWR